MIARKAHTERIEALLKRNPVVAILGARQTGKTTLANQILKSRRKGTRFDLEDSADVARLASPGVALSELRGLVVIDEIQRRPELFPSLRVLADRKPLPARFLVLGSASPELLRQSSESLAGRIAFHTLPGFDLMEVGDQNFHRRWLRGGFPRSYLARSQADSFAWRQDFIRTFVERDLPQLGIGVSASTMERFWTMLAHYHGQTWNGSEIARAFGVTDKTVRRYLDDLTSALVVRQLKPWFANIGKRQVKSPKIYIADSGLLHALLDVRDRRDLDRHPKVGASWEGFMMNQVARALGQDSGALYFWATHTGAELDLLWTRGRKRIGFEFKLTDAPRLTRSMRSALEALELSKLWVVHAGQHRFPMHEKAEALGARDLSSTRLV